MSTFISHLPTYRHLSPGHLPHPGLPGRRLPQPCGRPGPGTLPPGRPAHPQAGDRLHQPQLPGRPDPRPEVAAPVLPGLIQSSSRLGSYKAHWQTQGGLLSTNNDLDCIDIKRRHDPPQLYNVEIDPQELYMIKEANEPNYAEVCVFIPSPLRLGMTLFGD